MSFLPILACAIGAIVTSPMVLPFALVAVGFPMHYALFGVPVCAVLFAAGFELESRADIASLKGGR